MGCWIVKVLNKFIAVMVLILMLPLVTLILVFPEVGLNFLGNQIDALQSAINQMTSQARQIMIGVAAAVNLILILLLYLELKSPRGDGGRVKLVGGGAADVTFEAVSQRLRAVQERVGGIVSMIPHVGIKRRKINVMLEVAVEPETNVPNKIEQLQMLVREVVEQQMGFQLASNAEVQIRHAKVFEKVRRANPLSNALSSVHSSLGGQHQPTPPPPPPGDALLRVDDPETGFTEVRG